MQNKIIRNAELVSASQNRDPESIPDQSPGRGSGLRSKILLVDMNSFFASVEQQANPFWRGRPLGVCASLHETSCLIAASKEAKVLGIKTGTLVYKAKKICPEIILVPAEPEKYREVHRRINRIFADYTDRVEPYSIDESFLELEPRNPEFISGSHQRDPETSSGLREMQVAIEIKTRIRQEVGEWLTCSVGISSNKFLAKLAADLQKPDGLTMIYRSQLPEIYKTKKLSDLWGISHGWTRRLAKLGILTPLDLMNYPVANLVAVFGKPGYFLWERVNGVEDDHVSRNTYHVTEDPKSFGNSWVLNFRTTDKEKLKPVILRLAEKAARRMRKERMAASGFYLFLRLVNGEHLGQSKKLAQPIETGLQLYEQAMIVWKHWKIPQPVMHIAVGFTNLAPRVEQLRLNWRGDKSVRNAELVSASQEETPKRVRGCTKDLSETLDAINDKYGEFTVRSGLLTRTQDYAPDAIAFGK